MPAADPDCPKRMVHGPCGGVRPDLRCELADHPCPFTARPVVEWDGPAPATMQVTPPRVLTDLTVRPYDRDSVREVVEILAPACDAVLIGEHQDRPDYPPGLLAALVRDAGGRPWPTLTCRDRNRIVLEQELAGLHALGVEGVLAVTGDGRAWNVRPEVTQVFDLDSTRLAALAASIGLVTAVAATPAAPPADVRPRLLAQKERAGARLCVVNHVGTAEQLDAFVRAARAAGVTMPFVAGVAVYTDERSAAVLSVLPGLELDTRQVTAVLQAPDPVTAGIDAAVAEAHRLLAIPGVDGVNLSGLASDRGEVPAARIKAEIGRQVLG